MSIRMDRLENRYIVRGTLKLLTPLSISSGKANEETDSPFIRTKSGKVYIPGSSLRGAFRSAVERILASLNFPKLKSCILFAQSSTCLNGDEKKKKALLQRMETADEEAIVKELDKELCNVCKVFGTTFNMSKVKFTDLYLAPEGSISVIKRDGVGIDRDTETAVDGAKFDYEVVEKDAQFQFEMIIENADEADLAVLAIGLQELTRGELWIGGNGAAGLGRCTLESPTLQCFTDIKKYLEKGYDQKQDISVITGKLINFLEENDAQKND